MGDPATLETVAASLKNVEDNQSAAALAMGALATAQNTIDRSQAVLASLMAQAQKDTERIERQTDEYRSRTEKLNGEYRESVQALFGTATAIDKEHAVIIASLAQSIVALQTRLGMVTWALGAVALAALGALGSIITAAVTGHLGF